MALMGARMPVTFEAAENDPMSRGTPAHGGA